MRITTPRASSPAVVDVVVDCHSQLKRKGSWVGHDLGPVQHGDEQVQRKRHALRFEGREGSFGAGTTSSQQLPCESKPGHQELPNNLAGVSSKNRDSFPLKKGGVESSTVYA